MRTTNKTIQRVVSALVLAFLAVIIPAANSVAATGTPAFDRSARLATTKVVDVTQAHWDTAGQLTVEVKLPNSCYAAPTVSVKRLSASVVVVTASARVVKSQGCLQYFRTATASASVTGTVNKVVDSRDNKVVELVSTSASSVTS